MPAERRDDQEVAIPSGRGIRSGLSVLRLAVTSRRRNPLWSGHSFRQTGEIYGPVDFMSQSPLVGAFVPAGEKGLSVEAITKSQSPLVGAFVPAMHAHCRFRLSGWSQSPLVGAFVPADAVRGMMRGLGLVAIPSGRGIRSGEGRQGLPLAR